MAHSENRKIKNTSTIQLVHVHPRTTGICAFYFDSRRPCCGVCTRSKHIINIQFNAFVFIFLSSRVSAKLIFCIFNGDLSVVDTSFIIYFFKTPRVGDVFDACKHRICIVDLYSVLLRFRRTQRGKKNYRRPTCVHTPTLLLVENFRTKIILANKIGKTIFLPIMYTRRSYAHTRVYIVRYLRRADITYTLIDRLFVSSKRDQ